MEKIIAFVPARGGSKSIPLKNIKDLCGKPLIYWNLLSLENSESINKIIVSTDSKKIEEVVRNFNFSKVEIHKRSKINASDTASTESVIMEYIESAKSLNQNDIFILVQATSPLTTTKHFEEAIDLYKKGGFDSLLTCVRNKRFFWNNDGTSKNYDYKNRPRRQDFSGSLMENGSFYINRIKNIVESKNRLSGKIGIYEMPEYTAIEIDEEDDWLLMESLVYKYVIQKNDNQKTPIKLVAMDVDGVLTDSGMYYFEDGAESKKFSTYDGKAVELLRKNNIKTAIITSENTKIVKNRAKKLKIDYVVQGAKDKVFELNKIIKNEHINWDEVAYIGDDINDLELLKKVGFKACPKNARGEIKSIPGILILNTKGGDGALREFVDSF